MNYSEENLIPYFQPIIAIDSNKIYGYEILGRHIENDTVKSLGGFFSDNSIDFREVLAVDRIIREKGIKEFSLHAKPDEFIFINMRLSWLTDYAKNPQDMPTIKFLEKYNIDFSRVVIEFTEEDFESCSDYYKTALAYYKSCGIKIAIDDYGAKCSNIYRLAEINPDIIKIDMSFVHQSEHLYHYRQYLEFVTDFCDNLGIQIVYEGIENNTQLTNCINAKGRFYQGFYLSMPLPTINDAQFAVREFKDCFIKTIMAEQNSIVKGDKIKQQLDEFIEINMKETNIGQTCAELDDSLSELSSDVPPYIIRMYICNKYGFQISSNIEFCEGSISLINNYYKNWAWRGYFKNALRQISDKQKSFITKAYRDISSKEKIYTYAYRLTSSTYLFADIKRSDI